MNDNNSGYQSWRTGLQQEIIESSRLDAVAPRNWYWLIDACAHPKLPGILWELEPFPDASPLYMNTFLEDALQAGPWFLPYRTDSPITTWVFEQMEVSHPGFLLSCEVGNGNILFEHMQNMLECVFQGEQGTTKPGLYRFYDPRILYGLSTFHDQSFLRSVKGPALSLHAWDPGRGVSIEGRYIKEQSCFCSEAQEVPLPLVEHLWNENQVYTVIATLGGESGNQLRAMPLSAAYAYVESMRMMLRNSPYTSNEDIGFATAYSLRSADESWEDILEQVVFSRFMDCPSLAEALSKAMGIS